MFPVLLANAFRDGHITDVEAEARYALHQSVVETETAAGVDLPFGAAQAADAEDLPFP
jgi:hypothetical protein